MIKNKVCVEKPVGKVDDIIYFVDSLLLDDDIKGAVGTMLIPIPKEEYEYRTSTEGLKEFFEDIWRQEVDEGRTDVGLEEYATLFYESAGDESVFDLSYSKYHDCVRKLGYDEESFPIITCVGGGRCFNKDIKWTKIYDKKLLAEILILEDME